MKRLAIILLCCCPLVSHAFYSYWETYARVWAEIYRDWDAQDQAARNAAVLEAEAALLDAHDECFGPVPETLPECEEDEALLEVDTLPSPA
jgi:hypothetical protein